MTNICKIFTTKVTNCKTAGIQVMGDSAAPLIEFCDIENNKCSGIQVCTANYCDIRKNNIIGNFDGIEVISADPKIIRNVISRNSNNGIVTRTVDDLVCQPKIELNVINSNSGNGIMCTGYNN